MTHYPLRTLKAEIYKVVTVYTTEIEDGSDGDEDCKGKYVFRDETGDKFLWSPNNYRYEHHPVKTLAEADHVDFLCPKCYEKNGGEVGTHMVMVSFADRSFPDDAGSRDSEGKPSRWKIVAGTGLDDLSLTPSILLDAKQKPEFGCHWHGYVGSNGIPAGSAG